MGLYGLDCPHCKRAFVWFSGGPQLCPSCGRAANGKYEAPLSRWRLLLLRIQGLKRRDRVR